MPAAITPQSRTERWHRQVGGTIAHVKNQKVIAVATETPRGESSHAVGAHVGEGHGAEFCIGFTGEMPEIIIRAGL